MNRFFKAATAAATSVLAPKVAPLALGTAAPDFRAVSTHGEIVLSDLLRQGPVILAAFYADFTPG